MADPQTLIREAQEKAERLCRLAVEQTPPEYQSFIMLIEQRKRWAARGQAPVWATVRQPYLSADGRVKMARDQHREAGQRFGVHSEFIVEPTSGQLLARATLTSEIYGTVVAHARVFLGGEGVNESNPLENGETSAVARALGMWGFGCYGTGIASADEVLRVADRPESAGSAVMASRSANGRPGAPPISAVPPTDGVPDPPRRPSSGNSARRSGCGRVRSRSGGPRRPPTRRRSPRSAGSLRSSSRATR